MKHFDIVERVILGLEEYIVQLFMGAIVILMVVQVLSRFVFHYPVVWTDEVTRFSFVWLIMIGSAVGVYRGLHFTVSFLIEKRSGTVQFVCSILTSLALIAFLGVVCVYGVKWLVTASGQITASLEIPVEIPYSAIVVGAGLMLFHAIATLVRLLKAGKIRSMNQAAERRDMSC
jgi:TRAP-type C4-dicarboxylate transport system permease small subunit